MQGFLTEVISEWVDAKSLSSATITRNDLAELWSTLAPSESFAAAIGFESFEEAFVRAAVSTEAGAPLAVRLGGWKVNLADAALKAVLTSAVLAGFLRAAGVGDIPSVVLPAILPLLFELKRVRLTRSEKQVLATLTARDEIRNRRWTAETLYAQLPAPIQSDLSRLDFADFLEKCMTSGVADLHTDGTVAIRSEDEAVFRVSFE